MWFCHQFLQCHELLLIVPMLFLYLLKSYYLVQTLGFKMVGSNKQVHVKNTALA